MAPAAPSRNGNRYALHATSSQSWTKTSVRIASPTAPRKLPIPDPSSITPPAPGPIAAAIRR